MLLGGGARYLLLASLILALGSFLYFSTARRRAFLFRPAEIALFGLVVAAGLVGAYALLTGRIAI